MRRSRAEAEGCAKGTPAGSQTPESGTPVTRVFIVSNVLLIREALALYLSRQKRVQVVGIGEPSRHVADQCIQTGADIALVDMALLKPIDLARDFVAMAAPTKIVAFSVADVDDEVLACAESGMSGFVARNGTIEDLVAAVEHAMRGELRCSPRVAGLLFDRVAQLGARVPRDVEVAPLTRREQEIGGLIVQGLSNKAIAQELRIGTATVKNHVHSILDKLHVRRRGEAAARLRERVM
jgi:DNA-binding NarL/FixJ family response regulator